MTIQSPKIVIIPKVRVTGKRKEVVLNRRVQETGVKITH